MQDVAKEARVSVATVSHVINNTRFVSDETRKAVLDAIQSLSYSQDLNAKNFKTGKKHTIGFIFPDLVNSFFSNIVEATTRVLDESGYMLIIGNSKENAENEKHLLNYYSSGLVDGIIDVSTLSSGKEIKASLSSDIPLIIVDRKVKDDEDLNYIITTSYDSIYRATRALIRKNPKGKIAYIASSDHLLATIERQDAFEDAARDEGLGKAQYFIFNADSTVMAPEGNAYKDVSMLIENGVTSILASTNFLTQESLRSIYDHGLSPVRDIDIIGFFNKPYMYPDPDMVWIDMPGKELGELAGRTILELLNNQKSELVHETIPSRLINSDAMKEFMPFAR